MFFITRNEILSVLAFFVFVMLFKIAGLSLEYRTILIISPVALALVLSKLRNNRANIPVKGKGKKQGDNFLNDVFVDNKGLSYGATILWLSTLFVIVTELMKAFK